MVTFFRSERLQQAFEADGFVTVPVLTEAEVAAVTQHCSLVVGDRFHKTVNRGLYVGMVDEEDVARRTAIIQDVHHFVEQGLSRVLHPCHLLIGQYLIKPAGAPQTAPHQDPTMTDAHAGIYGSLTAWIALRDITLETGALGIIKGSHRFSTRVIGTPLPTFRTFTQGHESMLFRYLTFTPVTAGDAILFDTRCIHGAMPNAGGEPRAVVSVRITPKDAPLYQFFVKPRTTDYLLKLKVGEDYLVRYRQQELVRIYQEGRVPEHCEVEAEFHDDFTPLKSQDMEALCRRDL